MSIKNTNFADPFSIRLTHRELSELSALSQYDGLSRQELIRRALDAYLEDRRVKLLAIANAQRVAAAVIPPDPVPTIGSTQPPAAPSAAQGSAATGNPEPPEVASSRKAPLKVARR